MPSATAPTATRRSGSTPKSGTPRARGASPRPARAAAPSIEAPPAARAAAQGQGKARSKARPKAQPKSKPKRPAKPENTAKRKGTAKPKSNAKPKRAAKAKSKAPAAKQGARARRDPARPKRAALTAATADPMQLYQKAVQSPKLDAAFLAKTFKKLRGREARHLREDFCGTAYLIAAWLRRHRENTAEGFDIDPEPVAWGLANNFADLTDVSERASIHLKDVREPSHRRPDMRTAPNFSWMIFTERKDMLDYFRSAYADLVDDGLFVLDIYGGPEAMEEMEEVRKIEGGFTYVWDQKAYEPATGAYHCRIHFRFLDGSELSNVFDYRWRLWTLPEVVDILREAGFSKVDSWWEGTDEDGVSGNGVFRRHAKGENCPAWVTYIVAQR